MSGPQKKKKEKKGEKKKLSLSRIVTMVELKGVEKISTNRLKGGEKLLE